MNSCDKLPSFFNFKKFKSHFRVIECLLNSQNFIVVLKDNTDQKEKLLILAKSLKKQNVMKHILLRKAIVYKKRKDITPPKDYNYDFNLGAWIHKLSGNLLVNSDDYLGQGTKKLDIETGEDNKGQ